MGYYDDEYGEEGYEQEEEAIKSMEKDEILKIDANLKLLKQTIIEDLRYRIYPDVKQALIQEMRQEILTDSFKEEVKEEAKLKIRVESDKLFREEFEISDGWNSKRKVTFESLLKEELLKLVTDRYKGIEGFKNNISSDITSVIDDMLKTAKNTVKKEVETVFNETLKSQLNEVLFTVLMSNDTYKKILSNVKQLGEPTK